ncbi:MAG TPA: patatin-like phospholipase family protein [Thermoanaerobaculaceae bacterium]|nr:patatin-like phospholipase family protein [Thermoanaerobaculaceae bacterium]HRS15142.1 patatin-like phospholipase family protein [Thermoanaerobaculaceae bacterium]
MPSLRSGVVLALGSGGMRGVAHLGVMAELAAAGMPFKAVAATSSGALLGAMFLLLGDPGAEMRLREFVSRGMGARLPDIGEIEGKTGLAGAVARIRRGLGLLRIVFTRHAMTHEAFSSLIDFLVPERRIEDMPVPFRVVTTDHATGEEVWLDCGPLRLAIAASSAMPGVVAPYHWEGRRLQDGGTVAEIPVRAARDLGSPVLAVETSEGLPEGDPDRDRLPKAMFRAAAMGWQALRRRMLAEADLVISPRVNHLYWADYTAVDTAVAAGRAAAREFLAAHRLTT